MQIKKPKNRDLEKSELPQNGQASLHVLRNDEFEIYHKSHVFNAERVPEMEDTLLWLNDEEIGSKANIITVTGKAKSRKTAVTSALCTSLFLPEGEFLGFHANIDPDRPIVHMDTEQAYKHYYATVKRTMDQAKLKELPKNFVSVETRDATYAFRIEYMKWLFEKYRPQIFILDGVTDLMTNINDHDQSTIIGEMIMNLSAKYNCLIVCVIHTTKGNGFMTGAIGTYLEKKAETVIKVEKDEKNEDFSHISCQYSRSKAFQTFSITFDEQAGHYVKVDGPVSSPKKSGSKQPENWSDEHHLDILNKIFKEPMLGFSYKDFIWQITKKAGVGANVAKRFKTYYSNNKIWIYQNPNDDKYYRNLVIDSPQGEMPF